MIKILITGAHSYIGTSVEKYLGLFNGQYSIDTLSVKEPEWRKYDFTQYDIVFHVAGIAHVSNDTELDELYYQVNRDLAIEVARKAKMSKVKQFIFMSSGIIYGIDEPIGVKVMIGKETEPSPRNAYGKSKLEADLEIQRMDCKEFHTVCVRTPMVYGKACKGNFQLLNKYASLLPVLPKITNCRSMIHIENLSAFIKKCIDNNVSGVVFPTNREYISTNDIVETIRKIRGKRTYYSSFLGRVFMRASKKIPILRKIYGDLAYSKELVQTDYIVNDFYKSIEKSI